MKLAALNISGAYSLEKMIVKVVVTHRLGGLKTFQINP